MAKYNLYVDGKKTEFANSKIPVLENKGKIGKFLHFALDTTFPLGEKFEKQLKYMHYYAEQRGWDYFEYECFSPCIPINPPEVKISDEMYNKFMANKDIN